MAKVCIQPLTLTVTSSHPLWGQRVQSRTQTHKPFSALCRGQPLGPELQSCNCCIYILPAPGPHYVKGWRVWDKGRCCTVHEAPPCFFDPAFISPNLLLWMHLLEQKKKKLNKNTFVYLLSCVAHYDTRKCVNCQHIYFREAFWGLICCDKT